MKRKPKPAPVGTDATVPPPHYRFGSDGTLRCDAGSPELPTLCEWHDNHYWCEACKGYYGVPHDLIGCHTMQHVLGTILPNSTRPRPDGQCACAWCRVWRKHGFAEAERQFPRFRRGQD